MNESTFSLIPGRQIHIVSSSVGREVPRTLYLKRAVAGGQTACFQSSPVKITLLCTYIYVHFEHCPIIVIGENGPFFEWYFHLHILVLGRVYIHMRAVPMVARRESQVS